MRNIHTIFLFLFLIFQFGCRTNKERAQPNFIIIFTDDLGYGDLSSFGHPTIRTPSLDKMALEGMRLTQFYVGSSICTPSRAALLTGKLPVRTGMYGKRSVLFPDNAGGLNPAIKTISSELDNLGYSTACVGKWHLGYANDFDMPSHRGFERGTGILGKGITQYAWTGEKLEFQISPDEEAAGDKGCVRGENEINGGCSADDLAAALEGAEAAFQAAAKQLRETLQFEITRLAHDLGITTVYVTHDQTEAMTLADRIVVLNEGVIMQAGSPRELYSNPQNKFVAEFIGSPKMNLMPCREEDGQLSLLSAGIQNTGIPATGKDVAWLGVRPEHITLCDPKQGMLAGTIMVTEYLGSEQFVYVDCGFEDVITVRIDPAEDFEVGSNVGLMLARESLHLFDEGESRL